MSSTINQVLTATERSNKGFAGVSAPIILSVFGVYLTIGLTLGILPGLIKNDFGAGSFMVGLVIGLQALATLVTRAYSGKITDTKGAKKSNHLGILLVVLSAIIYLAAMFLSSHVAAALILICLARMVHGVAESLSVTGALSWGIGLAGVARSGKVMTWNGIAMYAGIAIGAPLAIWINSQFEPGYVFGAMILLSAFSWAITVKLPNLPIDVSHIRTPFYKVVGAIAGQGLGLAFSSIGFACISAFIALLFARQNWTNPSAAFVSFGSMYVLMRIFFASYPDRFGGYKVALASLIVELLGQLLIGISSTKWMAIAGCGLTGAGFSLIFPSLGVLAISKVKPQMRGTALGAFGAFFDLSLGLAGPLAGLVAGWFNYQAVYLFGAASCLLAMLILTNNKS